MKEIEKRNGVLIMHKNMGICEGNYNRARVQLALHHELTKTLNPKQAPTRARAPQNCHTRKDNFFPVTLELVKDKRLTLHAKSSETVSRISWNFHFEQMKHKTSTICKAFAHVSTSNPGFKRYTRRR